MWLIDNNNINWHILYLLVPIVFYHTELFTWLVDFLSLKASLLPRRLSTVCERQNKKDVKQTFYNVLPKIITKIKKTHISATNESNKRALVMMISAVLSCFWSFHMSLCIPILIDSRSCDITPMQWNECVCHHVCQLPNVKQTQKQAKGALIRVDVLRNIIRSRLSLIVKCLL